MNWVNHFQRAQILRNLQMEAAIQQVVLHSGVDYQRVKGVMGRLAMQSPYSITDSIVDEVATKILYQYPVEGIDSMLRDSSVDWWSLV